ncbi:MAG: amidohydrolase family protein [Clostridia bacterium]|nr:amidohydrolase family protein [Clostridia bacterium]
MLDLRILNGTLVIPGTGLVNAGVGIKDGKVLMLAANDQIPEAKETIDAKGKHVFPGLVDPHIHLGIFSNFADECVTETRAALAGGVTTVGVFVGGGDSYLGMVDEMLETMKTRISTDLFMHLSIFTPEQLAELPQYIEKYGISSYKFYMCGVKGVFPGVSDGFFLQGLKEIARLGDKFTACVHCEDQSMVDLAFEKVASEKPDGTLADWTEAGSAEAEEAAVLRACYLAEKSGARLYLVHMSSGAGAKMAAKVKKKNVFVETTSAYLSVNNQDSVGVLAKMLPPIKSPKDLEELWEAVADNVIDTFGTDNVSMNKEIKGAEKGLINAMPGYPILQTHFSAILHEGYHKRKIPLEKIAEKGSMNPAKIFGIYPQKGTIAVGSDADLVIVDVDKEVKVDPAQLHSFGDFSLHQGKVFKGWPVMTIKNGVIAVDENNILVEPGSGKYLRRV